MLGPHVKPRNITVSKLDTSDAESPPKKRKRESEIDQKINAPLEENCKLSEHLSTFDPKTITDTVIEVILRLTNLIALVTNCSNFMENPKNLSLFLA